MAIAPPEPTPDLKILSSSLSLASECGGGLLMELSRPTGAVRTCAGTDSVLPPGFCALLRSSKSLFSLVTFLRRGSKRKTGHQRSTPASASAPAPIHVTKGSRPVNTRPSKGTGQVKQTRGSQTCCFHSHHSHEDCTIPQHYPLTAYWSTPLSPA